MKNNLVEGKLLPTLLKFTIPVLFALLLQVTYGTVDLIIVGRFSQVEQVSAVTTGSQIITTITSLCTGLSMGTTILIGNYIGAKQSDKAGHVVGSSILLFLTMAIIIMGFLFIGKDLIITLMHVPESAIYSTGQYLFISSLGVILIVAYNVLGSVFRGIGDSKTPLIAVFIACIINILGDLLLTGFFGLGAMGAAIATVTAQGTSVLLSLIRIKKIALPFHFEVSMICFDKEVIKKVLQLGVPIALQSVLVSISFLSITAIINVMGVYVSAAVGVVEKLTGMIMLVPQAFMQSLSAFTAQNMGANKHQRAVKGLKYGILISLFFGVIMAYIGAFHGEVLIRFFTSDANIMKEAVLYLKSYSIDTVLVCFIFCFTGFFNGTGNTTFVMLQSIIGSYCIRVPLAYLISTLEGTNLFYVGLATPFTSFIQIIVCFIFYFYIKKNFNKEH
ncbi:MATE family efflux transporter [Tannockella kyphosi]|uniref:MATE family efflux transporter n=1 Tax=Tannockella kyphosi TaxID=2899121 RepID=UPI002011A2F0|nr:MATE family efflux transporter [Tannockella kyphosi]